MCLCTNYARGVWMYVLVVTIELHSRKVVKKL